MPTNVEQFVAEGARRLAGRAPGRRAPDARALAARVRASVEKYLLRHKPEASAREVADFIDALHADELMLVVACECGDEAAWGEMVEQYRATVLSAARSSSAGEAEAEELADSVWAELYGLREREDGTRAGKLAYYSGCGSLGGWLRAVVSQLAVDRHRRTSRLVQTEEASEFDRAAAESHEPDGWRPAPERDPESALAEAEGARAVEGALAEALGGLDAEDRLLVKLYYFDGLRLKEAGAVLGVHEATASRRLTRLHSEIRKRVETVLVAGRGWTREEAARALADATRTQTDADLRAMLTPEAVPTGERREELFE
ncbi:MAG TPA: sigma-70 family RNA polymerase sigma factor [Pyrinomonadaceae bacterium]|jgi:RNA polymerase sigma-70 factor (ECF subfamily)|nr:sigma-70 family RNA polymerase sigma factor [Pyrinomonadaceae bacterium]